MTARLGGCAFAALLFAQGSAQSQTPLQPAPVPAKRPLSRIENRPIARLAVSFGR